MKCSRIHTLYCIIRIYRLAVFKVTPQFVFRDRHSGVQSDPTVLFAWSTRWGTKWPHSFVCVVDTVGYKVTPQFCLRGRHGGVQSDPTVLFAWLTRWGTKWPHSFVCVVDTVGYKVTPQFFLRGRHGGLSFDPNFYVGYQNTPCVQRRVLNNLCALFKC